MKTKATKLSEINREWWHIDAQNQVLGRLATTIATKLIGKDKVYFTRNLDCGDHVVITNVDKLVVTGKKNKQKMYYRHSGFPGGFREITFKQQMEKDPRKVLEHAVKGMLPKNKLRALMLKRLRLFVGAEHNYTDKKIKTINI